MIQKSTLQLLRFHFSFFLLPIYLFALSQLVHVDISRAVLVFVILHLLVYPSSNGYNSYMDRDETPIGGIENPLQPTKQLYYTTLLMDLVALGSSFWVSTPFFIALLLYILASRAYSFRGIRLKKYALTGFLTVSIFQGAGTFWMVFHGCSESLSTEIPLSGMLGATFLIGGFYPLTQIYQHEADKADGVQTISSHLGYKGTFIFTAIVYSMGMIFLGYTFFCSLMIQEFLILNLFFLPVLVYFFLWAYRVWKDKKAADWKHTMRMNLIAGTCTNLGFLTIIILNYID